MAKKDKRLAQKIRVAASAEARITGLSAVQGEEFRRSISGLRDIGIVALPVSDFDDAKLAIIYYGIDETREILRMQGFDLVKFDSKAA